MTWTNEQKSEAAALVKRLETYQLSARLSDGALLRQFPDLGSTKTWRQRLMAQAWDTMRPDRTLARLRRIGIILDGGLPDVEFFPDLPCVKELNKRLGMLERQQTDRRILVALMPNGCGKTLFARWAVAQRPNTRVYCRMRPGWKNKELHIANGMCRALGSDSDAANAPQAEHRLVALLSGQPRTLFIDQAHEGAQALFHLLRMLVDETPSRFVYLGYDTAYRHIQRADANVMMESGAFLGRCLRPIFDSYKLGTQARDVAAFLTCSLDFQTDVAAGLSHRITPVLQQYGNLRLLSDGIGSALGSSDDDEVTPEAVLQNVFGKAQLDPKALSAIQEEAA